MIETLIIGLSSQITNMTLDAEHMVASASQDARSNMDTHNSTAKSKDMAHRQSIVQQMKKEVEGGSASNMKKDQESSQKLHNIL